MNLRSLRERKLLSQERLAEMSGLSLRTIQRVEAGHRVSYASLRSLAVTLEIDVDSLERELYAMNKATQDDFVEAPRWVRLLDDTRWFGGPGASRRDAHLIEAVCIAGAIIVFASSLLIASDVRANTLRACAFVALACGYLVSRYIRLGDRFRLWSGSAATAGSASAPSESQQLGRTARSRAAEYAYYIAVAILGTVLIVWLLL